MEVLGVWMSDFKGGQDRKKQQEVVVAWRAPDVDNHRPPVKWPLRLITEQIAQYELLDSIMQTYMIKRRQTFILKWHLMTRL